MSVNSEQAARLGVGDQGGALTWEHAPIRSCSQSKAAANQRLWPIRGWILPRILGRRESLEAKRDVINVSIVSLIYNMKDETFYHKVVHFPS